MLSYDSSMLAPWARGTDGNLFLLYRKTTFRLTFEESMNKHRQLERVGVQEPL